MKFMLAVSSNQIAKQRLKRQDISYHMIYHII